MNVNNQTWLKIIGVIAIITLLSISFIYSGKSKTTLGTRAPLPTPIPQNTTKVSSGDGTVSITLSNKYTGTDVEYTLSVTDKDATRQIFIQTLPKNSHILLPENAWSPDNKLFFIKLSDGAEQFIVYRGSGELFKDSQFLNINDFWSKTKNDLKIKDVTGWAGDNLLQIVTVKPDGSRGQNFWFDTQSSSFTALSR